MTRESLGEVSDLVTVCSGCDRPTWLEVCCPGHSVVTPTTHVRRESSTRKGAFHLLCRASMREEWHISEAGAASATCPTCLAILAREALAAA